MRTGLKIAFACFYICMASTLLLFSVLSVVLLVSCQPNNDSSNGTWLFDYTDIDDFYTTASVSQLRLLRSYNDTRTRRRRTTQAVTTVPPITRSDSLYKTVDISGDVILGGMFPVHQRAKTNASRCGPISTARGIQRLEAMLFTLDLVNQRSDILPHIKLGAKIRDSCSTDTFATEQILDFVRDSLRWTSSTRHTCKDNSTARARFIRQPISGFVGEAVSDISIQVSNILRLFKIPQISYASTSSRLSDKTRFSNFARTIAPDTIQSKALVDICIRFNWTYVSTVASHGEYGESGISYFIQKAQERKICIAVQTTIRGTSESELDRVISLLLSKNKARVIVLFLKYDDVTPFLQALKRANVTNQFNLLASDGWGSAAELARGLEQYASGAITIDLLSAEIVNFTKYFLSLRPGPQTDRNPWFREYWASVMSCVWPNSNRLSRLNSTITRRICTGNESIARIRQTFKQERISFIYDAVMAFAFALHRLNRDVCIDTRACKEMLTYDGQMFFQNYILTTYFDNDHGVNVSFDANGDSEGRYKILNYRRKPNTTQYMFYEVGTWESELRLTEEVLFVNNTGSPPQSRCSPPCKHGEAKHVQQGDVCCWICFPCEPHQYLIGESKCEDCEIGWWPDETRTNCSKLPELYVHWDSIYAIIPIVFASLGILVTLTIVIIYVIFNDTPIVKASGRELSYILLTGCLISYAITFALVAKPTTLTCTIQRLGIAFGFVVIYSALFVKTNRIARIFESATRSAKRPRFISRKSQVVISATLILVQGIFSGAWLLFEKPVTQLDFPPSKRHIVFLKCKFENHSFFISLIYIVILIATCTFYAIKTRKIPENFNESKFIGFTMYTSCIIWLAFVPIYLTTTNNYEIQITTLCISVSLSATVTIACLFFPRLYLIVFHPEKNVRKLTMRGSTRGSASFSTTKTSITRLNRRRRETQPPAATSSSTGTGGSLVHENENAKGYCNETESPRVRVRDGKIVVLLSSRDVNCEDNEDAHNVLENSSPWRLPSNE